MYDLFTTSTPMTTTAQCTQMQGESKHCSQPDNRGVLKTKKGDSANRPAHLVGSAYHFAARIKAKGSLLGLLRKCCNMYSVYLIINSIHLYYTVMYSLLSLLIMIICV